jgi:hypothetical protein
MAGSILFRPEVVMDALARWWRQWRRARSNFFDLKDCNTDEITRIAAYLAMTPAELQYIANYRDDWADLLRRRLATLGLTPGELAWLDPATFGHLAQRCARCESRGRCALDLADESADPAWQDWKEYCPNATMLRFLSAVHGCVGEGAGRAGSPADRAAEAATPDPAERR